MGIELHNMCYNVGVIPWYIPLFGIWPSEIVLFYGDSTVFIYIFRCLAYSPVRSCLFKQYDIYYYFILVIWFDFWVLIVNFEYISLIFSVFQFLGKVTILIFQSQTYLFLLIQNWCSFDSRQFNSHSITFWSFHDHSSYQFS